jgi:hypothetical protein
VRIAAITGAIAGGAPVVAYGETTPTDAEVSQALQHDFNQLAGSAERIGRKHAVSPTAIGTVALTRSRVDFGEGTKGTYTKVQLDAYDSRTRTLAESVIDISTPNNQKGSNTTEPNSLFQISLYEGKNNRASAPRTPAGFNAAIKRTASYRSDLGNYSFNLGVIPQDDSWQLTASYGDKPNAEVFSTTKTGPLSYPSTSATQNFDAVRYLIAQAGGVLKAAEQHRVLPKGTPADPLLGHQQ